MFDDLITDIAEITGGLAETTFDDRVLTIGLSQQSMNAAYGTNARAVVARMLVQIALAVMPFMPQDTTVTTASDDPDWIIVRVTL